MKKVFYLALSFIMCCLLFTACGGEDTSNNHSQESGYTWGQLLNEKKNDKNIFRNRFHVVYQDSYFYLIVDNETHVQYLGFDNGYDGGMVVVVDETGKPDLYKGEYD